MPQIQLLPILLLLPFLALALPNPNPNPASPQNDPLDTSSSPLPSHTPCSSSTDSGCEKDYDNKGQIAAGIISILFLILLVGGGIWWLVRRRMGGKDRDRDRGVGVGVGVGGEVKKTKKSWGWPGIWSGVGRERRNHGDGDDEWKKGGKWEELR